MQSNIKNSQLIINSQETRYDTSDTSLNEDTYNSCIIWIKKLTGFRLVAETQMIRYWFFLLKLNGNHD